MARGELGRGRVGGPVMHARVHVVSTGLGDAGSRNILVAFIDGVLHLLQELIDVDEIALGPDIGHGR